MMSFVDAISVSVTGGATLVLAIFTFLLWSESRKQRHLATAPDIGVYLDLGSSYNIIYLVVHNVGQGPAYNVTFEIDPADAGWTDVGGQAFPLHDLAMIREGLSYLAPQRERRVLYGPFNQLPKQPVNLTISYNGKHLKRTMDHCAEYCETFQLDVQQFEGLLHSTPIEREQLRAVRNVAKDIRRLVTGRSALRVDLQASGDEHQYDLANSDKFDAQVQQLLRREVDLRTWLARPSGGSGRILRWVRRVPEIILRK